MVIPLSAKVWGLRILLLAGLEVLCIMTRSGTPALALALVWGPTGLIYVAFIRGALRLPDSLVPVKRIEPVIYRWLGVGLIKKIVATRLWPMIHGLKPPERLTYNHECLDRAELAMRGAEVSHGAAFILMFPVALCFFAMGRIPEVYWILGFSLLLHAYPVMLQRANRWRLQQVRAKSQPRHSTHLSGAYE